MQGNRCAVILSCLFLLSADVTFGQTSDAKGPPKFRKLLRTGQAVVLRSSAQNPLFTLRLLNDEQLSEIETVEDKLDQLAQRVRRIDELLSSEDALDARATLLKRKLSLQSESSLARYKVQSLGSIYHVAYVGEDYVTLKNNSTERFLPFTSILYMLRSDQLPDGPRGGSPNFPRKSTPSENTTTRLYLQHIDAEEVASIISKLYSELNLEVGSTGNMVTLQHQRRTSTVEIKRLVGLLDTAQ